MIYNSFDIAWINALSYCKYDGQQVDCRNGGSKEILGFSFQLEDIEKSVLLNERRNMSPVYASAELAWYLSRSLNVEMIKHYAPQYEKFANDGIVHGAYGHRIQAGYCGDQLHQVMRLLQREPNTRQAIVQLWSPRDLFYALKYPRNDIPCTICWQFILRECRLHMSTYMRSNDLWLGTPYDVYCFTAIQKLMAQWLEVSYGMYTHTVGSLHYYYKDMDKVDEAIQSGTPTHSYDNDHVRGEEWEVGYLIESEENSRNCVNNDALESFIPGSLMHDSALLLAGQTPSKTDLYLLWERQHVNN